MGIINQAIKQPLKNLKNITSGAVDAISPLVGGGGGSSPVPSAQSSVQEQAALAATQSQELEDERQRRLRGNLISTSAQGDLTPVNAGRRALLGV